MFEITEKVELMNMRAVKVCAQAGTGKSLEPKNPGICVNF